jgi:hypothetical protein
VNHLSTPRKVVAITVAIATFQALMLLAFAWPSSNSGPREVPIAVAGPPEATEQIAARLAGVQVVDDTAAFDVTTVDDQAAATGLILDGDAYGAIVVTPGGPELLIASGASPAVANLLQTAASNLAQDGGIDVTDVVPLNSDDPNGAGLGAGLLPLVITSAVGGMLAFLLLNRTRPRIAAVLGQSVVGGLAASAILTYALGVFDGSYWEYAGIIALLIAGTSAAVAGLGALLGRAGAALGVLTMILLGNPLSGAANAPELLPQPWGDIGQALPPGAAVSAIRSAEFLGGASIGTPLLVLSIWAAGGLLLILVGAMRGRTDGTNSIEERHPRTIPAPTA